MAVASSKKRPLLTDPTTVFKADGEPAPFLVPRKVIAHRLGADAYVWTAEDVLTLRVRHRIVGAPSGGNPPSAGGADSLTLPLKLLPEEVRVGLLEDFLELRDGSAATYRRASDDARRSFAARRPTKDEESDNDSLDLEKPPPPERRQEWLARRKAKREKKHAARAPYAIAVGDASKPIAEATTSPHVAVTTAADWWWYPATERQRLEFDTFYEFWKNGYTLTPGSKFGGNYLAYEADPMAVHAAFALTATSWTEPFAPLDIVATGRVGVTVKKSPVMVARAPSGEMVTMTVAWEGAA